MGRESSPARTHDQRPTTTRTTRNQNFVTLRQGKAYPPLCCDVRAQYEETILDLKKKVEAETGVPVDKQLLFWHFKELTSDYDDKTLLDLNLHTGFSLTGYDLTVSPHY